MSNLQLEKQVEKLERTLKILTFSLAIMISEDGGDNCGEYIPRGDSEDLTPEFSFVRVSARLILLDLMDGGDE